MFDKSNISRLNTLDDILHPILVESGSDHLQFKNLSEDAKQTISNKVLSKILVLIKNKEKGLKIDDIECSKGDITKVKNYEAIKGSITFLNNMYLRDKRKAPKEILDVKMSFDILHRYQNEFKQAFHQGLELIMYLYTSLVCAVISASTFLIAATIDYAKDGLRMYRSEFRAAYSKDQVSKHVAIANLVKFNQSEKSGKLTQLFKASLSGDGMELDKLGRIAFIIFGSLIVFLFSIREIVYLYYYSRTTLAEKLEVLAQFVELNSKTLGGDKSKVRERQEKIVLQLKRMSDAIAVDDVASTKQAMNNLDYENKQFKLKNIAKGENDGGLTSLI